MRQAVPLLLCIAVFACAATAQPDPVETDLRKALDAMASLRAHGGWGAAYSLGGAIMWGEYRPIDRTWITVQPPATPTTAETYLRAAQVLGESRYEGIAREAVEALTAIQTPDGGFPYEAPPGGEKRSHATLDDDVTTSALRCFLAWWRHTDKAEDLARVNRVGAFLLKAQYEASGGWPQRYPPHTTHYSRHITFNDNVMRDIITALLLLHQETGEPRYFDAAKRGGDCIIRLQGGPGEAIWAQQYDGETLEPAWARKFEPPGYSAAESIGVCDTLIDLYLATGEERFLTPLPKAFEWYDTHVLENGKLARLYEPGTQRPVYGRRDRAEKVYDFENATPGYSWQADWYPHAAKEAYSRIQAMGLEAYLAERKAKAPKPPGIEALRERAEAALTRLTEAGWWLSTASEERAREFALHDVPKDTPLIDLGDFNRNANVLLDCLAAVRPRP